MPSLPYKKNRFYLSGMDWMIGALNSYMLSTGAAGNHSSLVIRLNGRLSEDALRRRIDAVFEGLPLLSGILKRDFINLAPFWMPVSSKRPSFQTTAAASDSELAAVLNERINYRFRNDESAVAFLLVRSSGNDILVMTFDHRLLDARGAETFTRLFSGALNGASLSEALASVKTTDAPELREWSAKFAAGRHVQREIIKMTRTAGCHVPMSGRVGRLSETPRLRADFHSFDPEAAAGIAERAEKTAGYLMDTIHLLAVSALSYHRVFRGGESEWFFVPTPIDLRRKDFPPFRQLLFNHFSFLFFHFQVGPDSTLESITSELRGQLLARIADDFPEKIAAAAYPGRIFPLSLVRRFMRLPFGGRMATFVFANVGDGGATDDVLGIETADVAHMPRLPSPPGLGVFFSRHSGRLNLSVVTDERNLPKGSGESLLKTIVDSL